MRTKEQKDRDLRYYELAEYFRSKAMESNPSIGCDMILHNLAERCPPQFIEDMDGYLCGKLLGMLECCFDALQHVPDDRSTPYCVKAALSRLGMLIVDIKDPKLKEMEEIINGRN